MRKIRERGITLIAMVITIVVLLILAGITIGAITGDNGIINKTGQAKEEAEIANEKEIIDTSTVEAMGKNKRGNLEEDEFQSAIDKHTDGKVEVTDIGEEFEVYFTETNRYYMVDKDGNIGEAQEVIKDKYPGDITVGKDGEKLDGSEENPYEIWCIEDLVAFSQEVNNAKGGSFGDKYVSLKRDLNFDSKYSYSDYTTKQYDEFLGGDGTKTLKEQLSDNGIGFKAIGDNRAYMGVFNGNGYKISNLYMSQGSGFFGSVRKIVKNLTIQGKINNGNSNIGGIIQQATSATIYNCCSEIEIVGQGVAGICYSSTNSTFINCCNKANLHGKWQSEGGGIVGIANENTNIYNSYNIGNIELINGTSYASVGGIVGRNSGNITIENCYNTGVLNSSKFRGAIVGNGSISLKNCFYLDNLEEGKGEISDNNATSLNSSQVQGKEKISNYYFVDLLNEYVKNNHKINDIELKEWKNADNYPIF